MKSRFVILGILFLLFTFSITTIAQILPENFDPENPEDECCPEDFDAHEDFGEVTEEDWLIFEGSLFDFLNVFSEKYHINMMNSQDTQRVFVNVRLYKKLVQGSPEGNPEYMNLEDFLFVLLDNYGFEYECIADIFVINKQMNDIDTVTESFFIAEELDFRDIVRQLSTLIDRRLDKIVYNEETRLIFFMGSEKTVKLMADFYELIEMALEEKLQKEDKEEPDEPTPYYPETPEVPETSVSPSDK